jgi:hypothetical protein
MSNMKDQLIRLGNSNPELRKHLRPVLDSLRKEAAHQYATFTTPLATATLEWLKDICLETQQELIEAYPRAKIDWRARKDGIPTGMTGDIDGMGISLEFDAVCDSSSMEFSVNMSGHANGDLIDEDIDVTNKNPEAAAKVALVAINRRL